MPKLRTTDHVCFECGITADHAHHVVPRVLGGTKTVDLCAPCHSKVHSANLTTSALVKEGLRKRRAKGLCGGGKPRFGYWYDQDGKVHKNDYEQKVIKGVLKMRGSKMSMYKIAKHYADEGVLNRNGNPIDRNQIRRIIEYAKRSDT